MDLDSTSAFELEVLSLLIAHEIARGKKINIWTDCQAAIKTLNGGKLGSLSYTLSGWTKSPRVSFNKVGAHPEKRKEIADWLPEEKGNYLADQVAGGVVEPMFTINASKWLSAIAARSKIIIKKKNGSPLIMDIRRHNSKIDSHNYLEERDEYRAADNKSPQWVGANISYHHKLM